MKKEKSVLRFMSTDFDKVQQKIEQFAKILEKFGLSFIQSIGEMKHQIGILTEKVEHVENELVEFKSIKNQLQEFERFRIDIREDLKEIKGPLRSIANKFAEPSSPSISAGSIKPSTNKDPKVIIENSIGNIANLKTPLDVKSLLETLKEQLYIITGGHRVLLEIREFERKVKPNMTIDEPFLNEIREKLKSLLAFF